MGGGRRLDEPGSPEVTDLPVGFVVLHNTPAETVSRYGSIMQLVAGETAVQLLLLGFVTDLV
jgi:hypothetical protein